MKRTILCLIILSLLHSGLRSQILGEPFISWDFANGIPENWSFGINSTTDLAHWEYRGPNTVPDVTVGARGSCAVNVQPLASQTQSNGFIIFDGNYWDDPGEICGAAIGSGIDPGPHTAWLITEPVDLSALPGAVLTFQQQYKNFTGTTTKVQISIDGGTTWTEIINNLYESPNVQWKSANVSTIVSGQSDVRFKFIYSGFYYWWLIDDITIYIPNLNDLQLSSAKYTSNQGPQSNFPLASLPYDQYPLNMIPTFFFSGIATNIGANAQPGTNLNVSIIRDNAVETYNQSSNPIDLLPSQSQTISVSGAYNNPAVIGDYVVHYVLQQTAQDDSPDNNVDSLDYSITNYTYARDEGFLEGAYVPNPSYSQYRMDIGNYYEAFKPNTYCHSIQVALAEGTAVGSQIKGSIYNQLFDSLFIETEPYTVNYADLNEPGEEKMITLQFTTPFELEEDSIYLVMAGQIDSTQIFNVGYSGNSLGVDALARFGAVNATFVVAKIPMVRMNLFSASALTGCTDPLAMDFDATANTDDGSCHYPGCTNEDADNYDPGTNFDDGSCVVGGCTDPLAANYTPDLDYDNGSCQYPGCSDPTAVNYDPTSNLDDGSCEYIHAFINIPVLSGCAPFSFSVENFNTIDEASNCEYKINDVTISNDCLPQFDYTIETAGEFDFTYTYMVNNAIADTLIHFTVFPNPELPVLTYDESNYQISCANCGANNYTWWYEGEILEGNENVPLNIFFSDEYHNGHYQLFTETLSGCSILSEDFVVFQPFFSTNFIEGCPPIEITASDLTNQLSGSACTLDFGDGTTISDFSNAASHMYETSGDFEISLVCEYEGVTGSFTIPITIFENVVPELINNETSGQVECLNCDLFETITWNVDGVLSTGNNSQPDGGLSYIVSGVTPNGCSGSAILLIESVENLIESHFSFYPNPADGEIKISNQSGRKYGISIYDTKGSIVYQKDDISGALFEYNSSALADGLYGIRLYGNDFQITKNIMIRH